MSVFNISVFVILFRGGIYDLGMLSERRFGMNIFSATPEWRSLPPEFKVDLREVKVDLHLPPLPLTSKLHIGKREI